MRDRIRRALVAQFHRPHGLLGRVAGWIMSLRGSNVQRNRWTVELLDVQPDHRVLELGVGPGIALRDAAERAAHGHVVGLDHSETMLGMAGRRNRTAVEAGRVELVQASFSELPSFAEPFDRIYSVNALQFADDPEKLVRSLAERLRPGGVLATTFQSRRPGATDEDARRDGEERAALFERAGLREVRVEVLPLEPVAAVCVLGRRPPNGALS